MMSQTPVLSRLLEVRAELDYIIPMLEDAEKRLNKLSEARTEALRDVTKLGAQFRELNAEHDELARLNVVDHE